MYHDFSKTLKSLAIVLGGVVFQWLWCTYWIWDFSGVITAGSVMDLHGICAIGANLPVLFLVLFCESWRSQFGRTMTLSIILNLIFAAFGFFLVLSADA